VAPQQRPDRGGGDLMPELEQFATNPRIVPAGVLRRRPQDHVVAGGRERGPPRPAAPAERRPLAPDEFPVPAEEGLGLDGEHKPGGSGEATAQGREDQPVARAPGDPLPTPPQDAHFVA
jgi:hypothetical protein